jgi:hypothetical protein
MTPVAAFYNLLAIDRESSIRSDALYALALYFYFDTLHTHILQSSLLEYATRPPLYVKNQIVLHQYTSRDRESILE